MKNIMKVFGLMLVMLMAACSKVPAGTVGVKFNMYGGDKGVQTTELPPGRYYIGWNEELYTFPTFTQTYTWQKSEGRDESLTFGTIEGLSVNADVGITYRIQPDKVTKLFQTYRKGVDEITDTYLRNMVRDALVKQGSNIGVEAVYGRGKASLIEAVQKDVANEVGGIGIIVEKVYWIGDLRLPQNVVNAINAKIQATQMAEQRNNEVAQATAEAAKEVAVANGQAQSRLVIAEAEAKAITLKGDAITKNPGVAQLNCIDKWTGGVATTQIGPAGICGLGVSSKGETTPVMLQLK
jgi:regulator of protease activity HflC (stomatin/prohibitin superfamily)